jgi:hypothetical protein
LRSPAIGKLRLGPDERQLAQLTLRKHSGHGAGFGPSDRENFDAVVRIVACSGVTTKPRHHEAT